MTQKLLIRGPAGALVILLMVAALVAASAALGVAAAMLARAIFTT